MPSIALGRTTNGIRLSTLATYEWNGQEPTHSGTWEYLTPSPCIMGVLALYLDVSILRHIHFGTDLHISICIVVLSTFPSSGFPRLLVFNRLGDDSKLFYLFAFAYRCFSSSRIFLKCTVLPWPVTLGPRLPASMVTGIGDSTRDARLHLSIFAYLLCGFHLIAYTCDIYFLLYSSCLML